MSSRFIVYLQEKSAALQILLGVERFLVRDFKLRFLRPILQFVDISKM